MHELRSMGGKKLLGGCVSSLINRKSMNISKIRDYSYGCSRITDSIVLHLRMPIIHNVYKFLLDNQTYTCSEAVR